MEDYEFLPGSSHCHHELKENIYFSIATQFREELSSELYTCFPKLLSGLSAWVNHYWLKDAQPYTELPFLGHVYNDSSIRKNHWNKMICPLD